MSERFFLIIVGDNPKDTTLADFGEDIAKAIDTLDAAIATGGPEGVHRIVFASTHGKYKHKEVQPKSEHQAEIAGMAQRSADDRVVILQGQRAQLVRTLEAPATELVKLDAQLTDLGAPPAPLAIQLLPPTTEDTERLAQLTDHIKSVGLDPEKDLGDQLGAKVTEAVAQYKAATETQDPATDAPAADGAPAVNGKAKKSAAPAAPELGV